MRRLIVFGALLLVGLAFAQAFGIMDRDHHERDAWSWRGEVSAEGWLHVRNREGSIRIEETTGPSLEVVASKSWTGRRPQTVEFIANRVGENVYVCALYGGGEADDCDEDSYRNRRVSWFKRRVLRVRDVKTTFTVRVPATARVNADTRNGRIGVDAPLAALVAKTYNGSIKAEAPVGTLKASSRNGSITAAIADGPLTGDIELSTRNGTVTLELPDSTNANVALLTRSGRVTTDFPLRMDKLENTRSISGILGLGGPNVSLETRNGSVHLKKRPSAAVTSEKAAAAVRVDSGGS
jgi:DUF4097 and DUF4098 domain-containing protein YvlB